MRKQNKFILLRKTIAVLLSVVLIYQTNISVFAASTVNEQASASDYLIYTTGNKDLLINEKSATVNGSIYSESGVIFTGNDSCIVNTVNAKQTISQNIICENNSQTVTIPDYTQLLENEVMYSVEYNENSCIAEQKLDLENSINVSGDLILDRTTFENSGYIMADKNIQYDAKNSDDDYSLFLYSKSGNITVEGTTLNLNGVIYAPQGKVEINAKNVVINGLIIADSVELNGTNITFNPLSDNTLLDYKPDIEIKSEGQHKEKRKLTLDISQNKAVQKIIPEKTTWEIVPEFETEENFIFIDEEESTYLTKQLIIKKAGSYKVNVTVSTGKKEYTFSKTLNIVEDTAPIADFYISEETILRNQPDGSALITADDVSYSIDGDYIQSREWSVKYDSDNDNDFTDEEIIYVSSNNESKLEYNTENVGKYLVELKVTEKFDDTIEKFITNDDYLTANTDNKNIVKKIIIVDNNKPEVSLSAEKAKNIDLVFTVGTSDTEKINNYNEKINSIKQELEDKGFNVNLSSVTTSTLTAKDTFAWKEYDHYNYSDRYLPTLDKHIIYDDSSIKMLGYSYAPLRDFLFVDDDTSSQKIFTFDMQRDRTDWHSMEGGGFLFNSSITDGKLTGYCILLTRQGFKLIQLSALDIESFRNGYYSTMQSAGKVIASVAVNNIYDNHNIKIVADNKTISVWDNGNILLENFELPQNETGNGYGPITCHASHACGQQSYFTFDNIKMETVAGNNLSDVVNNYDWRSDALRYVINLSDTVVYDINTDELLANVSQAILENDIKFIGLGNDTNVEQYKDLLKSVEGITADNTNIDNASETTKNFIISDADTKDFSVGNIVTTEDTFVMSSGYSDIENDPVYQEQWLYKYNPTIFESGEGVEREFESQNPLTQFVSTGEYTIKVRAKDNPVGENDSFDNFRKWSDTSQPEKIVKVHTRPTAVLKADVYPNKVDTSKCVVKISQDSFDADHMSAENKGIKELIYQWKNINDTQWTEGIIPESVESGETYLQMLTVKDEEDTLSRPAVAVISAQKVQQDFIDNEKPVVTLNLSSEKLNIGEKLAVSASATDNVCVGSLKVTLDGKEILNMAGSYIFTCDKEGTFTVQATATDVFGNTETVTKQFVVEDNTDRTLPTIEITSPVNGETTPTPVLNIEGSIYDDIELDYYKIEYKLQGDNDYITAKYSTAPVKNGILGSLNIEVVNGNAYEIRITAKDKTGNVSYVNIEYKISITEVPTEEPTQEPTEPPTEKTTQPTTEPPTEQPTQEPTEAPTRLNTPPVITITANKTKAAVGEQVEVEITVSDDDGISSTKVYKDDVLLMDSAGRLTFSESEAKTVTIKVTATDNKGLSTVKEIEILIYDNRDKEAPKVNIAQPSNNSKISGTVQFKGSVTDNDNISKYTLAYRVQSGSDFTMFSQGTSRVDNGTLGTLDTTGLPNGTYEIKLTAHDEGGNVAEVTNTYTIENSADNPDPDDTIELTLKVSQNISNIGDEVSAWTVITNQENLTDVKVYADEEELTLENGNYTFTSAAPKKVTLKAVAHDKKGREYVKTVKCAFYDQSDKTPPEVSLVYDSDNFIINNPIDLIGTVKDDKGIVEYRLWYCAEGDKTEITIADGNKQKIEEVLGTLDTTILANGVYNVYLSATDFGGNIKTCSVKYVVEGNLKIGNMSLSFEDINASLSGINLSVLRQYNNQSKTKGDFGVGWTLGMQSAKLTLTESLGKGYTQQAIKSGFFYSYQLVETIPHYVVVSYGDGSSDSFKLKLTNNINTLQPVYSATINFECVTNPNIKLQVIDNIFDVYGMTGDIDLSVLYDPKDFILTTEDNAKIYISADSGIKKIEDANGNTITITQNGYEHSDGKGVTFTRDSEGRIVTACDPNGKITSYSYDKNGDLVSVTNPMNNSVTFEYDKNHNITSIKDPYGIAVARNEYDENGRLTATIDAKGNRIEYTHDVDGRTEIVKDRMGNSTVYVYDENGNVLKETDALGNSILRTFDSNNNMLTQTDALGNVSRYEYKNGLLTKFTDADGNTVQYEYDSFGNIIYEKDKNGNISKAEYDSKGNLLKEIDKNGSTVSYDVDSKGNVKSVTDPNGNVEKLEYNSSSQVVKDIDYNGIVTEFTYNDSGNCIATKKHISDDKFLQTSSEYDALGNLLSKTDELGNKVLYEYDANSRLITEKNLSGKSINYLYDDLGNNTQIQYSDGLIEKFEFDKSGNKTKEVDVYGNVTVNEYDKNNLLIKSTCNGCSELYEYNSVGEVIKYTNTDGAETLYEYDNLGNKVSEKDALGNIIYYEYDSNGNITKMTDPAGNITKYEYNCFDMVEKAVYNNGTSKSFSYNYLGNLTQVIDQEGNTTNYTYNDYGKVTSVKDALNNVTAYEYDKLNRLVSVTDANNHKTSYVYDNYGNLIEEVLPNGEKEVTTYDTNGNVLSVTDFNGNKKTYQYNEYNQCVTKTDANGDKVEYKYNGNHLVSQIIDKNGVENYKYNSYGNLIEKIDANNNKVCYNYDNSKRITKMTTSYGSTSYEYDLLGRMSKVISDDKTTTYEYDAVGNRAKEILPNGVTTVYEYDDLNRLVGQKITKGDETLRSYSYQLSDTGNKLKSSESITGKTVDYAYDKLYQLTSEKITENSKSVTTDYLYDNVGNRIEKNADGNVTKYTYDSNNQLLSEGNINYKYDSNGNLVSKNDNGNITKYTYDYNNKMVSAQNDGVAASYKYDSAGNCISHSVNGKTTTYTVDVNRELPQNICESDGTSVDYYVYSDDVISKNDDNSSAYYLYDGQSSTIALTDSSGTITDSYSYNSFGELLSRSGSSNNTYLYTGQKYDQTTGFYYLRARYMDPSTGRFTSRDLYDGSLMEPQSLHKYAYCKNNPITYYDPTGLSWDYVIKGIIAHALITVDYMWDHIDHLEDINTNIFGTGISLNGGTIRYYDEKGNARVYYADILDHNTKEVYEIKSTEGDYNKQLNNYIDALKNKGNYFRGTSWPVALTTRGVPCTTLLFNYWLEAPGAIVYEYIGRERVENWSYVRESKRELRDAANGVFAVAGSAVLLYESRITVWAAIERASALIHWYFTTGVKIDQARAYSPI